MGSVEQLEVSDVSLKNSTEGIKKDGQSYVIGKTPSGESFKVPETHDMVRSLFDPTIHKSYGEILICLCLASNYLVFLALSTPKARIVGFLVLYLFWRLAYNFGIGIILYYQSNYKSLVNFAKSRDLFNPKEYKTILQKIVKLEIKSKMGKSYDISKYPVEFNTWIIFRQFVDLVLMQDFVTYIFLVISCGENSALSQSEFLNFWRIFLGCLLIGLNLWVKLDAHRVVKDYAWYWGDFFFLEENELIFDGVFNLSPHPMYSIGYIGYYGFALITKSYLILIVSLVAHFLQFIFLIYVENPHIEKVYGSDTVENTVEELEIKENYLKPLIIFKNFNPIRLTDYLTLLINIYTVVSPFIVQPQSNLWTTIFFSFALVVKLTQAVATSVILKKQSEDKFWTKLYLKYGLDNITAYSNWQALYNFLLNLSYSSLLALTFREILNGQYKEGNWPLLRFIIGGLLILLQIWTSDSIYESIGDFGWFYGDFFLPNLSRKSLTTSGIYRYLNDPERLLGISGIWGLCLITYSPFVFVISIVWTIHVTLFLNFVEKPHMVKIYGEQVLEQVSGVSLTIKQLIPGTFNNKFDSIYTKTFNKVDNYIKRRQSSTVRKEAPSLLAEDLSSSDEVINEGYSIKVLNISDSNSKIEIGTPIEVKWEAPATHSKKDWIGLYKVINSGSFRHKTSVSSSGHWIGVSEEGYDRPIGILKKESSKEGLSSGSVKFYGDTLWFEKGIYEIRYHHDNTHNVQAISRPFEIYVPEIKVTNDGKFADSLFLLINRVIGLDDASNSIDYKKYDASLIGHIVSESTGIEIAEQVMHKLKTVSQIAERVQKSKATLDELNKEDF